jgi:predicted Fe-Mo cluster-binding NifX family protein
MTEREERETAQALARILEGINKAVAATDQDRCLPESNLHTMRIAVPVSQGALAAHMGHCEQFALFDVAAEGKTIEGREFLKPPPHQPGALPKWLRDQHADVVIARGMGRRAQNLFAQQGVEVVVGADSGDPEQLVLSYLNGTLVTGDNICDH